MEAELCGRTNAHSANSACSINFKCSRRQMARKFMQNVLFQQILKRNELRKIFVCCYSSASSASRSPMGFFTARF